MFDPFTILTIVITFFVAGAVKGVIGLGLPSISLALLTAALGLPQAMALLLIPSFVTNAWQAAIGGNGREILTRIWPFLLMATVTVWIGALALTCVPVSLLSALLGVILVIYSGMSLGRAQISIAPVREIWVGLVIGSVNGVLTGMTGSFVVPGVLFLQAIGLPRDKLIQAMGMLFTASTAALAVALQGNNLLTADLGALSAAAVIPAIVGMAFGQRVRQRLSEGIFRRVFFLVLMLLGIYIAARALAQSGF